MLIMEKHFSLFCLIGKGKLKQLFFFTLGATIIKYFIIDIAAPIKYAWAFFRDNSFQAYAENSTAQHKGVPYNAKLY